MFGKGKIEIQLKKHNLSAGEVVKGTVLLKLKKPLKAKELSITMIGEEKVSQISLKGQRSTKTIRIFDFKQTLDREKEYSSAKPLVYKFKIKIPKNILSKQEIPKGKLGTVIKTASFLLGAGRKQVHWYLLARLDVPWAIDINKKVQINIT